MLPENQENSQHQYTLTNFTQCMDNDNRTFCSNYSHHTHLPWRNHKIYSNKEANSHLVTTPSLQCYIAQLPSTPMLSKFTFKCQYFSGHGEPNTINISSVDFDIWQHLEKHQNESQLHHLASIPSVPVDQLYRCMISGIHCITPFTTPKESTGDTDSIWTLFSHTGVYVMAIRSLIPAGIRDFLLLFLLVSTCQISVPTFTTRYHAVYHCV